MRQITQEELNTLHDYIVDHLEDSRCPNMTYEQGIEIMLMLIQDLIEMEDVME